MADISTYLTGNQSTTETRNPYGSQYSGLPSVPTGNLAELLRIVTAAKRAKEDRERRDMSRLMQPVDPHPAYSERNNPSHADRMQQMQEQAVELQLAKARESAWNGDEPMFIKDPFGGQVANKNALSPDRQNYLQWIDSNRMLGGGWSAR